jgi:hypothetical protein
MPTGARGRETSGAWEQHRHHRQDRVASVLSCIPRNCRPRRRCVLDGCSVAAGKFRTSTFMNEDVAATRSEERLPQRSLVATCGRWPSVFPASDLVLRAAGGCMSHMRRRDLLGASFVGLRRPAVPGRGAKARAAVVISVDGQVCLASGGLLRCAHSATG